MNAKIKAALDAVNHGRRTRRLSESDVEQVLDTARESGVGWATGGMITVNAYNYPATTAAVAAVAIGKECWITFASINAKGSPVTWFGPTSVRDIHLKVWRDMVAWDRSHLKNWIKVSE